MRPVSNFNLVGAAQVGKSSLTGMRLLHRLEGRVPVWPVDPLPETGSAIVEIYTSIASQVAGSRKGTSKLRSYETLNDALVLLESLPVGGSGPIDDHSSDRSEEHTSELQSLMRISYAVFCLKKKKYNTTIQT